MNESVLTIGNGITISLQMEGNRLMGIGSVCCGDTELRNPALPLAPYIRSVDGMDYARFELNEVVAVPDGGFDLHTVACGEPRLESAYADEYDVQQIVVRENRRQRRDILVWHLRPASVRIEDDEYSGFSYAWTFHSTDEKLYRILVQGTWEIAGDATGNTLLSQGQVTPPVHEAARDSRFTSACLKSLSSFGNPLGMSYQLCPRYGLHQCFDFLAHPLGTLLGYWQDRSDVRSFIQKNPGEDVIHFVDAYHFQLTNEITLPAKHVVFSQASEKGLSDHEGKNRWRAAWDHTTRIVQQAFNIRPSRPLPRAYFSHHLHQTPAGELRCRTPEGTIEPEKWLAYMADHHLPAVAATGNRRVWTDIIADNDAVERGRLSKLQAQGPHGDWLVGSVCNIHRYRPSALFGGMDAWRYFYNKAHSHGLEVGHWMGCNFAYNAPILQEHPDWIVYDACSLPASGGYPRYTCAILDWNTPVRDWIMDDLRSWKATGGLDFVFIDSWPNLGMQPVNFAREMSTCTYALAGLVAELQRDIGEVIVESLTPLAGGACGITDYDPSDYFGTQGVVGQNAWQWYEENEDMLYAQTPHIHVNQCRDEESVRRRFFRCLANRCVGQLTAFTDCSWHQDYIRSYLAMEPDLVRRELLPERQGVLWYNGTRRTLFAFRDMLLPVGENFRVVSLVEGIASAVAFENGIFSAKAWDIYQIDEAIPGNTLNNH